MNYHFLLEISLILFSTKALGMLARKLGMPQVVGALVAGIILGPSVLGWANISGELTLIAEIGVILIMFEAGLETSFKDLKECGLSALLVAAAGVLLPLVGGFLLSALFHGGFSGMDHNTLLKNIFIGVIITATSVSITVDALREMGKLKTKAGTIIMSAAIIDDVLGIVILSIIISTKNAAESPVKAIMNTVLFFVLAIVVGIFLHKAFKMLAVKYPHKRRIPIFALAFCLLFAYCSEHFFGVADITGAFIAGLIFSGANETSYIETKIDSSAYMVFAPVFFACIGMRAVFTGLSANLLWFSVCFVIVAILTKALGCYSASRLLHNSRQESFIVGVGMIARGEVCLIVMQKGIGAELIGSEYLATAVMLVITSSLLAPIFLRLGYRHDTKKLVPVPAESAILPAVTAPVQSAQAVADTTDSTPVVDTPTDHMAAQQTATAASTPRAKEDSVSAVGHDTPSVEDKPPKA